MDHELLEEVSYAFPTSCFLSPPLLIPQDLVVLMSAQTCPALNQSIYIGVVRTATGSGEPSDGCGCWDPSLRLS